MRSVFAAAALIGDMFGWLRHKFQRGDGRSKARAAERHRLHALRLRRLFDDTHGLMWRTLRRLGVPADRLEHSFQQAYVVISEHLSEIEPGGERAFAYRVALRAARVSAQGTAGAACGAESDEPSAELRFDRAQLLAICDRLLDRLAPPLREVFVLRELEGLHDSEIAALLEIPQSTMCARLLCARLCLRDDVQAIIESHARSEFSRG